jgi:trehalose 6-phosphate synthase
MQNGLKVALVSNRGPVSFIKTEAGFDKKRGAGGLAGALDPVARRLGGAARWISAATSDADREALQAGEADSLEELLGYPVHMLEVEPSMYQRYYDVVSNRMLWFANHCLWDELDIREFGKDELEAWDEAYEPVNRLFARAAADYADPDSLVLFQDYHLATAPSYLRNLHPDQTIFHFTHSSFCGPEGLERLPRPLPQRVIEGMLGADLVGFHVPDWANAFLACCEKVGAKIDHAQGIVEHKGRRSWVRAYPIPIDPAGLRKRAQRDKSATWKRRFLAAAREHAGDEPILIVRADRTEPSKNIIRGFEAFGLLLDRRPDLAQRARFIACLYPSRQSMPEYRRYTKGIKKVVAEVLERHPGSIDLYLKDDFDRTLAALRIYDVLLVNPIMDGMNLVSKEGPVLNEVDGVLVLTRGAGSFDELGKHAVEVDDALNVEATAAAIERAIELGPEERASRARSLREAAEERKPGDWIDAQLADLVEIQGGRPPLTPPPHA